MTGTALSDGGYGVYGFAQAGSGTTYGVAGRTSSPTGWALYAFGDFGASGLKSFRIDHPTDPENAYLVHYATESPYPQNFYSGNVTTGADGGFEIVWWLVLVLPWAVNFIAQSLEDYVLNPLIQGKATELHPVVIMLAVLAGGSLAGLYGMLLAVPVAACVRILLAAEIMPRLRAWAGAS